MVLGANATYAKSINKFHFDRVVGYLKDHGGELVYGGQVKDGKLEPTVVLNASKTSNLYLNEVFGPIMKVQSFKNIDEVIDEINDREKALSMYYFGWWVLENKNLARIQNETSAGMLVINDIGT